MRTFRVEMLHTGHGDVVNFQVEIVVHVDRVPVVDVGAAEFLLFKNASATHIQRNTL